MEEEFDEDDELELEGEGGEGEHVHGNDDMGEGSGAMYREVEIREQDRYLPVANIARIMKRLLPVSTKVGKDAKESIQSCVSEFISFITSEASDKCQQEKRKTINGDDLLWAMGSLGFEKYIEPLKIYLAKYRDAARGDKPEKKPYVRREQSNNSSSSKSSSASASSSNNNPPSSSTTTTSSSNHVHSNVQQPVVSLPQAQPPVAQTNNISNANRNPSPVVSSNSHNLHLAANRPNMNNSLSGHSNVIGSGGHGHSNVSGNSNVIGSGGHGHSNVPGNINYNHLTQVGGLNSMSHPNVIVSHPHVHVNMMQGSGNLHGSNMQGSGNLQGSNMQGSGNLQGSNMQGNLMMHNQLHGNNMNANSAIPSLLNSNVPIGGMGGNLLGRHTIGGNQMMGLSNGGHPHASGSQMLLPGVSKVGSNSSVPLLPGVSTLGSAYNNHLGLNKNSGLLPKTPNTGGMNSMPPRTNMNTSSSVSPVIAPRQALSPQMLSNSPPRTALPNSSGSVNGNVNTIAGATTVVNNSVTTSPVPTNTSVVTNAIPYPNPPPSNPNTSARTASANLEVVQTNTSNAVYVEANTSPDKNKRQKL